MNNNNKRFFTVGSVTLLAAAAMLFGCDSSKTSDASDPDIGSAFVASEENVGSISLSVGSKSVGVGATTTYAVRVRNADGAPVQSIRVACDTEQGLAIIEPTSGFEMTDSFGNMSGVVGCEAPGSFQIGCRLPIGANKRKFESIVCTGDVPTGFAGFPDAAGGGLGGGVAVIEDDDDFAVRITSILFTDANKQTTSIDSTMDLDCDNDTDTPADIEFFTDTTVAFQVENNSSNIVRITEYKYLVADFGLGGSYETPWISLIGEQGSQTIDSDGDSATFTALFLDAHEGSKRYFGRDDKVSDYGESGEGFKNITFTLRGENSAGETITLKAKTAISIDDFNNCS